MSHLISRATVSCGDLQEGEEGPKTRDCRQENGVWVTTIVLTGETVEMMPQPQEKAV